MSLKELNIKLTMDVTGNEERAIDNLMADIKNNFIGHCWSEQHYLEENQDKNYAYLVNDIECNSK